MYDCRSPPYPDRQRYITYRRASIDFPPAREGESRRSHGPDACGCERIIQKGGLPTHKLPFFARAKRFPRAERKEILNTKAKQ